MFNSFFFFFSPPTFFLSMNIAFVFYSDLWICYWSKMCPTPCEGDAYAFVSFIFLEVQWSEIVLRNFVAVMVPA